MIKRYSFFVIVLSLFFNFSFSQDLKPVAKIVENAKAEGRTFTVIQEVLQITDSPKDLDEVIDQSKITFFKYNENFFQSNLKGQDVEQVSLALQLEKNNLVILDLVEVPETFYDYEVRTSSGSVRASNDEAVHYRGIVRGMENNSLVALSFYKSEMSGFVAIEPLGNYFIGKLKNDKEHIIFNKTNIESDNNFRCFVEDIVDQKGPDPFYTDEELFESDPDASILKCVRIYFETEVDMFNDLGSVAAVEDYVTNLFNQMATIYLNESITVELSEINVWDTTDPYNATQADTLLAEFQAQTGAFNGDLGQLLTFRSIGGGIAASFSGLCNANTDLSLSVSGNLENNFPDVPTFSWTVEVATHEFGHLFGARHTHACVWNGDETQIDDCGSDFFFVNFGIVPGESEDCYDSANPIIPNLGGTVMSYCHLQPVGINFNLGFGFQPGNVIRNRVVAADCVQDCEGCTPEEVTITANEVHDITDTLTYTVICGQNCVTINATNVENAVYNTSDPVLNDLQGLFCFGDDIQSFVVNITGFDSCGDPYEQQVTIYVEQDCIELECCDDNNQLENGDFDAATCGGNGAFNSGCVPNWTDTERTPSINGFGSNPYAWMWSYDDKGEGIAANFDFEEGSTYTICFRIRADDRDSGDPHVANNATINFVATNNTGDIVANPTGDIIFQETMGPYLNVWTNVSVEFTPTADFSQLWIFPYMAEDSDGVSQAELSVDDISICCAEKEISIVPYWDHPDCPEVVCEADKWPIHVIDEDGNPITSAGGVIIEWTNEDTGEVFYQDFVYAQAQENWSVKVTYPGGCEYTATYYEDCCDDDVFIEAIICPTEADIAAYEEQLALQKDTMSNEAYNELSRILGILKQRAKGEDCDPCDIGWVLIRLVDADGNDIDPSIYDTIVWSDGGSGTMRLIPVDFVISVTLTQVNENYECEYTAEFEYPCDEECNELISPENLQLDGALLTWDPVPGAVGYVVESTTFWPAEGCRCDNPVSIAPIETTETSVILPLGETNCFVVQVRAICADGTLSAPSDWICVGGERGGTPKQIESAKVTPNPTDGYMNFTVQVSEATKVTIEVRDFYGVLRYRTMTNVTADEVRTVSWNGKAMLTNGIYFVTFKTDHETIVKKVIVK